MESAMTMSDTLANSNGLSTKELSIVSTVKLMLFMFWIVKFWSLINSVCLMESIVRLANYVLDAASKSVPSDKNL